MRMDRQSQLPDQRLSQKITHIGIASNTKWEAAVQQKVANYKNKVKNLKIATKFLVYIVERLRLIRCAYCLCDGH